MRIQVPQAEVIVEIIQFLQVQRQVLVVHTAGKVQKTREISTGAVQWHDRPEGAEDSWSYTGAVQWHNRRQPSGGAVLKTMKAQQGMEALSEWRKALSRHNDRCQ